MSTSNNTSNFYTPEEIQYYLSQFQHQSTMAFIPALVYLCLLIVLGSVGNSLVLSVYCTKMAKTPLRIFIIIMAVIDLLTNVFIIPGEIYDMFHIWNFDARAPCRFRLYFNASFEMSSAFLLVAIAANRYHIVCRPFENQVTVNQAKLICVILILSGHITALPYYVILGSQTITTPKPEIETRYCQVDDSYVKTIWPTLTSAFFFCLFLAAGCLVSIFYVCIGSKVRKQTKQLNLNTSNPSCSSVPVDVDLNSQTLMEDEKIITSKKSHASKESTSKSARRISNHKLESSHQSYDQNLESNCQSNGQNLEKKLQNDDQNLETNLQNDDQNLESICQNEDQNPECSGQFEDKNVQNSQQTGYSNLDSDCQLFYHKIENNNTNFENRKHSDNQKVHSDLESANKNVDQRPASINQKVNQKVKHQSKS